jgi:hypothetical protein
MKYSDVLRVVSEFDALTHGFGMLIEGEMHVLDCACGTSLE